ncbi:MAG: response regulator [Chloroflexi bacterium]|nr:response regulator [Chloroflexota bacterium]
MKTILLIDDEAELRENLAEILAFEDYQVFEAKDGFEGFEKAQTLQPDLILCDIAMPGIDGFELLKRLRHTASTATIPIIMVTARAEPSAVQQGITLGANGYIKKPFDIDEALLMIRQYLYP